MQLCTSLQTDNHASTPPLSFLQAGCPSCRPNNSVKALKAYNIIQHLNVCYSVQLSEYVSAQYVSGSMSVAGVGVDHEALLELVNKMPVREGPKPAIIQPAKYHGGSWWNWFYPHDAMLVLVLAMALCLSVCHMSVFYLNGWTDRAGFWHMGFFRPVLHRVLRKFIYLQKYGYFPLELCPKLQT